jgi:hypothetical protein
MKNFAKALAIAAVLLNVLAAGMSIVQKHYFQAFNNLCVAAMFTLIWIVEVHDILKDDQND